MAEIELFVFLLFAVAVLAGLGLRSGVPYPIALVLGASRLERLEARLEGDRDEHGQTDVAHAGKLLTEMIEAERDVLKKMRSERAFRAETLQEIERELDLDESRVRARMRL